MLTSRLIAIVLGAGLLLPLVLIFGLEEALILLALLFE
jgi:hypothetical protein